MYEAFSVGSKRSFTSSVKEAFKKYMAQIQWNDSHYNSNDFMEYWMEYSKKHSSWFGHVNTNLFSHDDFQKELLTKVNTIIKNIIEKPPSNEKITTIERLISKQNTVDIDYCCEMEADFHIKQLEKMSNRK